MNGWKGVWLGREKIVGGQHDSLIKLTYDLLLTIGKQA